MKRAYEREAVCRRQMEWCGGPFQATSAASAGERPECGAKMILGLGSDLIDIRRIEKTLEKHGERFIARVFTDIERAKSDHRNQRAASYAKRFAPRKLSTSAVSTSLTPCSSWRSVRGLTNATRALTPVPSAL